jgi:SAM-dependent methyltransferase
VRLDLAHIQRWITPGSRVLDLGCGDGEFLQMLESQRQVKGLGLEIDTENITAAIARGLNILEQDLDKGLEEMLRIGKECVVTFPNFGHWRCRWHLGTRGKMPRSKFMPYSWYDTPNIHFCTVKDFESLCDEKGIRILGRETVGNSERKPLLASRWPNLFATTAIYRISR